MRIIKQCYTEEERKERDRLKEELKMVKILCYECGCRFIEDKSNLIFTCSLTPSNEGHLLPGWKTVCPNCKQLIRTSEIEEDEFLVAYLY